MSYNAPDAGPPTEPGGGGDGGSGLANPRMYSEVYFDSDSEEDTPSKNNVFLMTTQLYHVFWTLFLTLVLIVCFLVSSAGSSTGRRRKQRTIPTNDELLYDPDEDDRDQAWVDARRRR